MIETELHHGLPGERTLMRIHVGEADRVQGQLLYEAIVDLLRRRGLSGATVLQSMMGFGARRMIHSLMSDVTALDMPVVIECVDTAERLESVLPELDTMIGGGIVTLERADVILYRPDRNRGPKGGA